MWDICNLTSLELGHIIAAEVKQKIIEPTDFFLQEIRLRPIYVKICQGLYAVEHLLELLSIHFKVCSNDSLFLCFIIIINFQMIDFTISKISVV